MFYLEGKTKFKNLQQSSQIDIIFLLQGRSIIHQRKNVLNGPIINFKKRKQVKDDYVSRCNRRSYAKEWFGLKKGIFFENKKLTLKQILLLIYLKRKETSIIITSKLTSISSRSAGDIFFLLRDKIYEIFLRNPIRLEGGERIVKIDKSKFN